MSKSMGNSASKIEMKGYDELLGAKKGVSDGTINISVRDLHPFKNHPYRVVDDEKMMELTESIKNFGVMDHIIARRTDDGYELISGHRRKRACEIAGIDTVPVGVLKLDDDQATVFMVDSNLQREELLPSEKAWAYRMKKEALNHNGKKSLGQVVPRSDNARDIVGAEASESGRQISRYVRLTYLMPELLEYVDRKKIGFVPGVNLSYLNREEQGWVYEYIVTTEIFPNLQQTDKLKVFSGKAELTEAMVLEIIEDTGKPKEQKNFSIPYKKLRKYFAPTIAKEEIEAVIIMLLNDWKNQGNEKEGE